MRKRLPKSAPRAEILNVRRTEGPFFEYVQRSDERLEEYQFKSFRSTRDGDEVAALREEFPKLWHVEEFFNAEQSLGWDRAGSWNLNIRYGK
jgi:hypothetical protein